MANVFILSFLFMKCFFFLHHCYYFIRENRLYTLSYEMMWQMWKEGGDRHLSFGRREKIGKWYIFTQAPLQSGEERRNKIITYILFFAKNLILNVQKCFYCLEINWYKCLKLIWCLLPFGINVITYSHNFNIITLLC